MPTSTEQFLALTPTAREMAVLVAAWHHRVHYKPAGRGVTYHTRWIDVGPPIAYGPRCRVTTEVRALLYEGFITARPSLRHPRYGAMVVTDRGRMVIGWRLARNLMRLYGAVDPKWKVELPGQTP